MCSQSCATITTVDFRPFHLPKNPEPVTSHPTPLIPPSAPATVSLLAVSACLLWTVHVNGIPCWSFETALTASCPPGGCVSALFLFMAEAYSTVCLSIPQPCTPGSFHFLATVGASALHPVSGSREPAHSQPLPQVVPAGQPPLPIPGGPVVASL